MGFEYFEKARVTSQVINSGLIEDRPRSKAVFFNSSSILSVQHVSKEAKLSFWKLNELQILAFGAG